jgi:hypothetical protein
MNGGVKGIVIATVVAVAWWLLSSPSSSVTASSAYDGSFQARPASEVIDKKMGVIDGPKGTSSRLPHQLPSDLNDIPRETRRAKRNIDDQTKELD